MREIKFRAYNTFDRVLVNDITFERSTFTLNQFLSEDRFKLMQYTGLKDKNGKEIYENDRVKILEGHKDHLNIIYTIVFYEGAFCFLRDGETIEDRKPTSIIYYGDMCVKNGLELSVGNYIEVVGSIYENTELLK